MNKELLPCPFCGGEAAHDKWDDYRDYAGCRQCDFWTLMPIWNRRATLRTKLEEAERKLADARREGMEEAARMVDHTLKEGGGTYGDAILRQDEGAEMKRLIKPSLAAIASFALVSGLFWLGGWNFDDRGVIAFVWAMSGLYFGGAAFGFVYLTEGQE